MISQEQEDALIVVLFIIAILLGIALMFKYSNMEQTRKQFFHDSAEHVSVHETKQARARFFTPTDETGR